MGTSTIEKTSSTETTTNDSTNAPASGEDFQWSVENEVHLFHALIGNKPVGINKHFHMASICEKFSNAINKEVTSKCVWKYLEELYNFEVLDDIEVVPFANEEKDFVLPETEYGTLMKQKMKDIIHKVEDAEEQTASPRTHNTSRSTSRGAASKETTTKSSAKKEHSEKSSKDKKDTTQNSADSSTPSKSSEKDSSKSDPRRDSKDSTSSNKDASKTPASASKSTKETKVLKSNRSSVAEKLDESSKSLDDSNAKRGTKRSTRGSLKSEEPTPPSRRRRI